MKSNFADYVVHDLLGSMEGIRSRAMFGGHGIYHDDKMFAIIVDDELYYKVGALNLPDFKARHSEPFTYVAKGNRKVSMSYWKLPEDVIEDRELLLEWTDKAIRVSRLTPRKKP